MLTKKIRQKDRGRIGELKFENGELLFGFIVNKQIFNIPVSLLSGISIINYQLPISQW
ncbi:MAG TPA: hypothetical protein VIJ75_08245 [Hanamia sp.]